MFCSEFRFGTNKNKKKLTILKKKLFIKFITFKIQLELNEIWFKFFFHVQDKGGIFSYVS